MDLLSKYNEDNYLFEHQIKGSCLLLQNLNMKKM